MINLESYPVREVPASDIWIIGEGEIGDKAGQLVNKTAGLRDIGFRTPPRFCLAEGFFDAFFQENGLGKDLHNIGAEPEIKAKIKDGSLTGEQFGVLQRIHSFLADYPTVAVRSSAMGDARGTGVYVSKFCRNGIAPIGESVQMVLASYFSEDAKLFRKDARTGEGFGVIIEPLISQPVEGAYEMDEGVFLPYSHNTSILSGYGYSSTLHDQGYVSAVLGLGGGVQSRNGERISRDDIEQVKNLRQYMLKRSAQTIGLRRSDMIQAFCSRTFSDFSFGGIDADMLVNRHGNRLGSIELPKTLKDSLDGVNLLPFFNMISQAEKIWGKPQYLEWVMTIDNNPLYWITQIADVEKRINSLDFVGDFENHGSPLFVGQNVLGFGIRDTDTVIILNNPFFDEMYQFNEGNKDYVLIYEDRLCSSVGFERSNRGLRYSHLSNAHTVLELPWNALAGEPVHANNPIAHFEGMLERTDKFFGVIQGGILDGSKDVRRDLKYFREKMLLESSSDIQIYRGPVRVVADERQNRLVLNKR